MREPVRWFQNWYGSSLPHVRAAVDATLDDLEGCASGGFSRLDPRRRAELLRTTAARGTVAQAVALAGPPPTATAV